MTKFDKGSINLTIQKGSSLPVKEKLFASHSREAIKHKLDSARKRAQARAQADTDLDALD